MHALGLAVHASTALPCLSPAPPRPPPPPGMNWVRDHVKRYGWRGVVNMSLGGKPAALRPSAA